jgi:hypothetical protein
MMMKSLLRARASVWVGWWMIVVVGVLLGCIGVVLVEGNSDSQVSNVPMGGSDFVAPIQAAFQHVDEHSSKHRCFHHFVHFDNEFIRRQISSVHAHHVNTTVISDNKLTATLWLAKAAIHLPGGDFVDAGSCVHSIQ